MRLGFRPLRPAACLLGVLACGWSLAPPAQGQATRPAVETAVNGYLDSRLSVARVRTDGLFPADDVPAWTNLTEFNTQLKLRWGDRGFSLVDASFFYQRAWAFPGADHDVPAYRPLSVISEGYASYNVGDHLNLTVGKKRIVWGSGQALNPTDLLNPPKDPTDPTLQRAGAWLLRVEAPFERFTLSLVGAGKAFRPYGGVPSSLVYDSRTSLSDDKAHYALAARMYALVADSDLGLYYVFTNRYNDAFENKSRVGASVSRVLGKVVEFHAEVLVQRGTVRPLKAVGDDFVVKGLLGPRYTFADDATLGLEYYFNGDGYTPSEFDNALQVLQALPPATVAMAAASGGDSGTPQKFAFDPQRRHYAFVSYMKPRIHDDFTLQATLLCNLQDGTGSVAPMIVWSVREWVNVTLAAFVPLPAVSAQQVAVGQRHYGEFSLSPVGVRGLASVRLFY